LSIPCPCEESQCGIELSQLPLVSGCPANNEWMLFGNTTGGLGAGLYARRLWSDVKACLAGTFNPLVFIVGRGEATDPIAGQSTWTSSVLVNLGATNGYLIQFVMDNAIYTNYGAAQNMTYDRVAGTIDLDYNGSGATFIDQSGGSIDKNQ
jgi:hypothetical protein